MSGKRLQLKRGTTTQTSTFTGLDGEVTVDTTKKTLVVHDGSTVGGTVLAKATDVSTSLALKVNNSEKGVANGVSTLDVNGKVVLTQIPDSVLGQLEYMGVWDFTTVPTATQKGQYWIASVSGNGYIVGDWAVWNGSAFDKVDNTDAVATVAGRTGNVVLTKSDVGLANADNTSDVNKPISTAQQTALNLKANLANPTFTGTVTSPTFSGALTGTATTATTALNQSGGSVNATTGRFNNDIITLQSITIGTGGNYSAGSIYSDSDWGMIFRAKQSSPTGAQFMWANSANTELFRFNGTALTTNITGNAQTATSLLGDETNWTTYRSRSVANMLSWKNYGNGHCIFDASNGTAPNGVAVNNTNPTIPWGPSHPTLMGWNGVQTYGVRVDSARYSETCTGNAATATNASNLGGNAPGYYQQALGFTPIQQGGGASQGTSKIFIGWQGPYLRCQIDNTDFGTTFPMNINGNAATATALSGAVGSAPSYACRAWVNFNGTGTVAIRASGNVSSITDNGVGDYTVNFTTAMPDANYSIVGTAREDGGNNTANFSLGTPFTPLPITTSFRILLANNTIAGAADSTVVCASIFR